MVAQHQRAPSFVAPSVSTACSLNCNVAVPTPRPPCAAASRASASASERESAQFSARQLMLMSAVIDFADSAARSQATALLNSLLMSPQPGESCASAAVLPGPLPLFGLDGQWRAAVCGMAQLVAGGRLQGVQLLALALKGTVAALTRAQGEKWGPVHASSLHSSSCVAPSASHWLHALALLEEVAGRVASGREWRRLCQQQAVDEQTVQQLVVEGVSGRGGAAGRRRRGCPTWKEKE